MRNNVWQDIIMVQILTRKLTVYSLSMMCPFIKTIATSLSKSRADALALILNKYNVPREEVAGIIDMLNSVSMKG